jgi:hypothetical protein
MLVASLIALFLVYATLGVDPRFLGIGVDADPPLDKCVTEQAVLRFLDGKIIFSTVSTPLAGVVVETITLRKEKISSLIIQAGEFSSIYLRFSLDHENKQYQVEANFMLTTSDDPSLHYHGWVQFMGQVITSRPHQ